MRCPYCATSESKVIDKRNIAEAGMIRRRRECLACSKRFTTYEKIDMTDLMVIKKSGRKEEFDAEKLKRGITRACEKRPINIREIDKIVDEVENSIRDMKVSEISSDHIGNAVVTILKELDKVACIRFASVYKSFQTINEFESEVQHLLSDN